MKKDVRPRIGLLQTGLNIYYNQYPNLKEMGQRMFRRLIDQLESFADVVDSGLVDTYERAAEASQQFVEEDVDILLVFPLGYTTGMMIAPSAKALRIPIRLLNAHEDASYDYRTADTELYLHHEGACPIPEYSCTLVALNRKFKVITGCFEQDELWKQIRSDCMGAAAAKAFTRCRFGVIGNTYTDMVDMPVDEHRVLRATGQLICRPEIQEVEEAYDSVTEAQLQSMFRQFRDFYEVEETVLEDHMCESARIAAAFDTVIRRHHIDAFGYYWWGRTEKITELRAQSALAVSRLTALGVPGVTEGDIKAAMAMKILCFLGGGGMFVEFFSVDYKENFILMGHDGPSNVDLAQGKPKLQHMKIHHGKTGEGLGIDFLIREEECTLLNLTQAGTEKTFKLIYTVGDVVGGDILHIGNPNCRVRIQKPIPQFFNEWCTQGPGHHSALGIGDLSKEIETFAEAMDFECVKV